MTQLFFCFIEGLIRNIGGGVGIRIRRFYYKRRLKSCGKSLTIAPNVFIEKPALVSVGDNVWIDKGAILIAGKLSHSDNVKWIENANFKGSAGEILIGNCVHIGISTIIQGHGGVEIGNFFTTSAGCKIYSLSNDPDKCRGGTMSCGAQKAFYVQSPLFVGDNVWLGLNVSLLKGCVFDDTFVQPNSVIVKNLGPNVIAGGFPAQKIRNRF